MPKILIVEDDKLLQKVYQANFGAKGFEVDTATDGLQAWEKIQQAEHDIVLLDLMLPKLSGQEVLKRMRSRKDSIAHLPVVVLSNIDEDGIVRKVKALGATAYLFKDKLNPQSIVSEVGRYVN